MEFVRGKCPRGCGSTLFLGDGGYVTCSWFACPEPDAASTVLLSLGSEETAAKAAAPAVPSDSSPSSCTCFEAGRDPMCVIHGSTAGRLGSDETGAKPADVRARISPQPSGLTDSSPSSREARHGVAQALVDRVRRGLAWRGVAPSSDLNDAEAALEAMLVLIDELADRLYAATARQPR